MRGNGNMGYWKTCFHHEGGQTLGHVHRAPVPKAHPQRCSEVVGRGPEHPDPSWPSLEQGLNRTVSHGPFQPLLQLCAWRWGHLSQSNFVPSSLWMQFAFHWDLQHLITPPCTSAWGSPWQTAAEAAQAMLVHAPWKRQVKGIWAPELSWVWQRGREE